MTSTRSNHRLLKAACGLAVSATIMLSATAAFAASDNDNSIPGASSNSVGSVQAKCDAAIAARMTRLGVLDGELAAAANVTTDHRAGLEAIITATEANLAGLKTQIDAATTLAELRPLCTSIVVDNRVYVLRTPQVDLTIHLDNSTAHTATRQQQAADLQTKIAALKAAGKDTTKAEADLAKMNTYIAASQAAEAGKADALIALTPASYNADHNIVSPIRNASRRAEIADTRAAYWGVRTVAAIARIA